MPDWMIGACIMAAVVAVATVYHYYRFYKRYHYVCATCETSFTPSFRRSLFALNGGDVRMMKCPACGKIRSVRMMKNQKPQQTDKE